MVAHLFASPLDVRRITCWFNSFLSYSYDVLVCFLDATMHCSRKYVCQEVRRVKAGTGSVNAHTGSRVKSGQSRSMIKQASLFARI